MAELIDWKYISRYQKLSEDFIEQHADEVNWVEFSGFNNYRKNLLKNIKINYI